MAQSVEMDQSRANELVKSALASFPPVSQWSRATIHDIKSTIRSDPAEAAAIEWSEGSPCTRALVNAIVGGVDDNWDWQRLKTCSNAEYISLPIHTISLLNDVYYSHAFEAAHPKPGARRFNGYDFRILHPGGPTQIGYPIFRVDYSCDELFMLYKTCWDRFLEAKFYRTEIVDPRQFTWPWIDDKARLDGKGPSEVRTLFNDLSTRGSLPPGFRSLWRCLMVDREAIESMLRVFGPPARLVQAPYYVQGDFEVVREVSFLPYLTAVDTNGEWNDRDPDPRDIYGLEYAGLVKCALQSVFVLLAAEDVFAPQEAIHPRNGRIFEDGTELQYEPPGFTG
ncbi:hypothetical protein F4678DRAFT_453908 [Xylaria arbuscula]|nr:hypothetical protein F4678DRAFT_453908 [Xylaria arbuscula]